MKMLSEFITVMLQECFKEDLPLNILVDGKYYDISEFYFDCNINEYILKLESGIPYDEPSIIVSIKELLEYEE